MNRTVVLVQKAKRGDADALDALIQRYYHIWLRRYHGRLGAVVRQGGYDTEDLVQSAVASAIVDLPKLQNEAVFFTWVTSIIRHKLAKRRARQARERRLSSLSSIPQRDNGAGCRPEDSVEWLEGGERISRAIVELFPKFPHEMTVVQLSLLDELPTVEIMRRLGRPKTTICRWFREGKEQLRRRLK